MRYLDGSEVRVGDLIRHGQAEAVVETIIGVGEVAGWGLEKPGFLILCDQCGRVLIEPDSPDWEDVARPHPVE